MRIHKISQYKNKVNLEMKMSAEHIWQANIGNTYSLSLISNTATVNTEDQYWLCCG